MVSKWCQWISSIHSITTGGLSWHATLGGKNNNLDLLEAVHPGQAKRLPSWRAESLNPQSYHAHRMPRSHQDDSSEPVVKQGTSEMLHYSHANKTHVLQPKRGFAKRSFHLNNSVQLGGVCLQTGALLASGPRANVQISVRASRKKLRPAVRPVILGAVGWSK